MRDRRPELVRDRGASFRPWIQAGSGLGGCVAGRKGGGFRPKAEVGPASVYSQNCS